MEKKLNKEELDELTDEYFDMLKKQGDLSSVRKFLDFAQITIPNYIQSLILKGYKAGYEAGYEDATQEKINNIIKRN